MKWVSNEHLRVSNGDHSTTLPFNTGQLDDFEEVLAGDKPARYSNPLRSDLYLRVQVALGLDGMIPERRTSEVLLQEEPRDWAKGAPYSDAVR